MLKLPLHQRARELLRAGDQVCQPFGEPLAVIGCAANGNYQIPDGPARGRLVDALVEAPEGYWVAVEIYYTHRVPHDKEPPITVTCRNLATTRDAEWAPPLLSLRGGVRPSAPITVFTLNNSWIPPQCRHFADLSLR